MKTFLSAWFACALALSSSATAQDTFPAGVVYGPKAAFKISAPEGWILDNKAGVSQGLHCVLYPKGSTWADSEVVMYAKIASTTYTEREKFVGSALAHYTKTNPEFKSTRVAEDKTGDGHSYWINEYRHGKQEGAEKSQFERVAYVQLPGAVAYVVLTCPSEELLKKHADTVKDVMKAFTYTPDFINFRAGKKGTEKPKEDAKPPAPKKP